MHLIIIAWLLLGIPARGASATCEMPPITDVVDCGADVSTPGNYALTDDLNCAGQNGAGIVLRTGVALDLRGHTVRCLDGVGDGITLLGKGVVLHNGRVTDCTHGVVLGPFGDHSVSRITADATVAFGMRGWASDNNHLVANVGRGNVGFAIKGDGNSLTRNTALAPTGYELSGDGNRLTRSTATAATGVIVMDGSDNEVARNVVRGDDFGVGLPLVGIDVIGGTGHRISRNVVRDGAFEIGIRLGTMTDDNDVARNLSRQAALDLVDETCGCGDNRWSRNLFFTSNQPNCIR